MRLRVLIFILPNMIYQLVPFSMTWVLSDPWPRFRGHVATIGLHVLDVCARLTHHLTAIFKFFLFPYYFNVTFLKHACIVPFSVRSSSEHIATLAVTGELYAYKCAFLLTTVVRWMIVQTDESSSAAWKWPVTVQKRCQQAVRSRRYILHRSFVRSVTKANGRAVATGREAYESGREWESTPFVFSSFTSLFDSFKLAFRHDGNTAFVRTFYYNVTAIRVPAAFAPRDSEPARRGVRRLSLL